MAETLAPEASRPIIKGIEDIFRPMAEELRNKSATVVSPSGEQPSRQQRAALHVARYATYSWLLSRGEKVSKLVKLPTLASMQL